MQYANRLCGSFFGATAMLAGLSLLDATLSCAAVETADRAPTDVVTSTWQHHKVTFSYFGFTSLYTCDGLEDHVRQILLHLGARRDVHVSASGCPGPYNTPSNSAWVAADFYALTPVADAGGSDTVSARWTPLEVTPRRPSLMGDGDCELIQEMKDLIIKNFSLRDIEYRTSCVPYQLFVDGFAVKGQILRALPLKSSTVKG
jgi:hypothetical protein